jgi:hypothetical protein
MPPCYGSASRIQKFKKGTAEVAPKRKRDRSTAERIDIDHHHYRIVAGQREGKCQAVACVGHQKVDTVTAESVALAVDAMKHILDERLSHLHRQRINGVPTEQEYREGLVALKAVMPDGEIDLLGRHSHRPGATASLSELARAAGQEQVRIAESYARLGRRLGNLLQFVPNVEGIDPALAPIAAFALVDPTSRKGDETLRLRPEVIEALQMLKARVAMPTSTSLRTTAVAGGGGSGI